MSVKKTCVAVIFGGRSVEHDVSIVTAQQIMKALSPHKYEVLAVYITRDGKWFMGDAFKEITNFKDERITARPDVVPVVLSPDVRHHGFIVNPLVQGLFKKPTVQRVDVLFPAIHGSHGEDGTLQGLFELADIPYVGFATLGSALTNDKWLTKQLMRQNGIPVLEEIGFSRAEWQANAPAILEKIQATFTYPVFVKPATLGSSIGVGRADNETILKASIDIATTFDRRVLVEPAVTGGIEVNCSVIGYGNDVHTSILEQPISWAEFLAFEDKYLRGSKGMKSQDRLIPAPIGEALTDRIKTIAKQAFQAVDGRGIVRIDFLVKPTEGLVYLNELNTLPGSLSFYLWQPVGISQEQLVDKLISYARDAYSEKRSNVYDYKTSLLSVASMRGSKGLKGTK